MITPTELRKKLRATADDHLAALDEHLTDDQLIALTKIVMAATDYDKFKASLESIASCHEWNDAGWTAAGALGLKGA